MNPSPYKPTAPGATAGAPPPLSPAYVKDTISALTATRRALNSRLDRMNLFTEPHARPDDPVELQLLFAARDDYLAATTPKDKFMAMSTMTKLVHAIRDEAGTVTGEMNRLLITAMQSETAQKKINAMIRIAENKNTRITAMPTLADMIAEDETNGKARTEGRESDSRATESPGSAPELQTEPSAAGVSPV